MCEHRGGIAVDQWSYLLQSTGLGPYNGKPGDISGEPWRKS